MKKPYQFLTDSIRSLSVKSIAFLTAISGFFTEAFLELQNYTMTNFIDRAIGNASIYAVDTAKRSSVYYASLLIFALTFVAGALIVHRVRSLLAKKSLESSFKQEGDLLFEFSLLQIFWEINMFSYLIREPGITGKFFGVCLIIAIIGLLLFHSLIKFIILTKTSRQIVRDNLTSPHFIFLTTVLTFVLLYPILMFVQTGEFVKIASVKGAAVYAVLFLASTAALLNQKDINRIVRASCPLLLSPLPLILGTEIQYTLTRWISISPKFIAGLLFLILVLCSVCLYLNKKQFSIQTKTSSLFDKYAAPFILIDVAALTSHDLFIGGLDFLHQGNAITPAQQLLQFGRIPFVDYWGATNFPIDKLFFGIINGFAGLEPLAAGGIINSVFLTLICYFVLKQVITNRRWIVITLIFAFFPLTSPHYLPAMLPLLVLNTMREQRRFRDYAAFLALSLLAFVWMPSAGKISVISAFVLTVLCCSNRKDIFNALKAFAAVFGISALAYFILCYMRGYDLRDQVALIKAFTVIDEGVAAYPILFKPDSRKFEILLSYGLLPVIPILTIIYIFFKNEKKYIDYYLVYIAIACIICFQRAYGRHSLYEGPQFGFYFLLLFIVCFVLQLKNKAKLMLSAIVITIGWIFAWGGKAIPITNKNIYTVQMHRFIQNEKRYNDYALNYPHDLKIFLDTYLTKEQTFYENINANMLYPLTERKSPFIHHGAQMLQVESAQEAYIRRFEKEYNDDSIPIVIMDGTPWYMRSIDDIYPSLATSKLTEWIYRHYAPWVIVDGYNLWLDRNSKLWNKFPPPNYSLSTRTITIPEKKFIYKAGVDSIETLDVNNAENSLFIVNIINTNDNNDHEIPAYVTIPIEPSFMLSENNNSKYLKITYKTNRKAPMNVLFDYGDGFLPENSITISLFDSINDFMTVQIPIIGGRNNDNQLCKIRLEMHEDITLELKDITLETSNLPPGIAMDNNPTEHFSLKKLPFVWANYDKKTNKVSPPTLLSITDGVALEAKQTVELPINGDYKRDNGNYLYFEIDSPAKTSLDVAYGANKEGSITFDILPGKNKYMVRISAQYNWMNQHQSALFLTADKLLTVETLSILEGD